MLALSRFECLAPLGDSRSDHPISDQWSHAPTLMIAFGCGSCDGTLHSLELAAIVLTAWRRKGLVAHVEVAATV